MGQGVSCGCHLSGALLSAETHRLTYRQSEGSERAQHSPHPPLGTRSPTPEPGLSRAWCPAILVNIQPALSPVLAPAYANSHLGGRGPGLSEADRGRRCWAPTMDSSAWGAGILCLLSPLSTVSSQLRPSCLSLAPDLGATGPHGGPAGAWRGPYCPSLSQESLLPRRQWAVAWRTPDICGLALPSPPSPPLPSLSPALPSHPFPPLISAPPLTSPLLPSSPPLPVPLPSPPLPGQSAWLWGVLTTKMSFLGLG